MQTGRGVRRGVRVDYFFFPFLSGAAFFEAVFLGAGLAAAAAGLLLDFLPPKAASQPSASLGFDPTRTMVTLTILRNWARDDLVTNRGTETVASSPPLTCDSSDRVIRYRKVNAWSSVRRKSQVHDWLVSGQGKSAGGECPGALGPGDLRSAVAKIPAGPIVAAWFQASDQSPKLAFC
jgi:hypothetical protein